MSNRVSAYLSLLQILSNSSAETLGLKSIGKAGKAVTKQLGRTLTKIGESPDKRGHERMFLVQNPQFLSKGRQGLEQVVANAAKTDLGLNNGKPGNSRFLLLPLDASDLALLRRCSWSVGS